MEGNSTQEVKYPVWNLTNEFEEYGMFWGFTPSPFSLKVYFFLKDQFYVHSKIKQKLQRPHTCTASSTINISAPKWYIRYSWGTHKDTSLSPSLQFTTGSLLVLSILWGLTNVWGHASPWYHTEYFYCPKHPLCSAYSYLLPSYPLSTTDHLTVSIVLPFPECQIVGVKQYTITFSDYLSFFFRICIHILFLNIFLIGGYLLYNVVLISARWQCKSAK